MQQIVNDQANRQLLLAVAGRDHDGARAALAAGASPNAVKREESCQFSGVYSETPALYVACAHGDKPMVELLLEKGADPNSYFERQGVVDREGIPCLIVALAHFDIVALLLSRGADANRSRYWGEDRTTYWTPLSDALSDHPGNKELEDLLRRHGAKVDRG